MLRFQIYVVGAKEDFNEKYMYIYPCTEHLWLDCSLSVKTQENCVHWPEIIELSSGSTMPL